MASSRRKGRPPHDDILTPAEWRIVHAVKHGMTNGEIAERRGISRDAVKFHIANALAKLGLPNRRALRRWHQAPKGSALGQLEGKMNSPLKLGPIGQISRSVKSIEQSAAWYGEVLGLPHLYTFGAMRFSIVAACVSSCHRSKALRRRIQSYISGSMTSNRRTIN